MSAAFTEILECRYSDAEHSEAVIALLSAYIADEMGGGLPLTPQEKQRLIGGLSQHPTAMVLLAKTGGAFSGMLVAFENFSTFTAKPMVNIHDLIVLKPFRGKGVGRLLMSAAIQQAEAKGCSRITLEVRKDNAVAQNLYRDLGFAETSPEMYYWRKELKS
ncbi:MAG: GNAT family N-acetyltransferase [Prevotellaceae bacterium]|jgi:ribosomal protein S18 acetylase RimI-like enzyme|nr:GNAT family N-acetyltransferase [Prevotellaceae bacterium]